MHDAYNQQSQIWKEMIYIIQFHIIVWKKSWVQYEYLSFLQGLVWIFSLLRDLMWTKLLQGLCKKKKSTFRGCEWLQSKGRNQDSKVDSGVHIMEVSFSKSLVLYILASYTSSIFRTKYVTFTLWNLERNDVMNKQLLGDEFPTGMI